MLVIELEIFAVFVIEFEIFMFVIELDIVVVFVIEFEIVVVVMVVSMAEVADRTSLGANR